MNYGFFPGCAYSSEAGYQESVNALNGVLGIELTEIQDWNCCGATTMFSLNHLDALALTGRLFALADRQGFDQIVTTCNACYTTLRKSGEILNGEPQTLSHIKDRLFGEGLKIERILPVRHYLEILYHDIAEDVWRSTKRPEYTLRLKVAAYYGCQLTRPWGDLDHPERPTILDRFIQRIGYSPVDHSAKTICCGGSHFMPYEKECRILIRRIISEVQYKGAQVMTTLCPLCQFNLDASQDKIGLTPIPVPYFTQLAGLVLGLSPDELGMKKLLVPIQEVLQEVS